MTALYGLSSSTSGVYAAERLGNGHDGSPPPPKKKGGGRRRGGGVLESMQSKAREVASGKIQSMREAGGKE